MILPPALDIIKQINFSKHAINLKAIINLKLRSSVIRQYGSSNIIYPVSFIPWSAIMFSL